MDRDTKTLLRALDRISHVLRSDDPTGRVSPFAKQVVEYVNQVHGQATAGVDLSPFRDDVNIRYVDPGDGGSRIIQTVVETFYVGLGSRGEYFPVDDNSIPTPAPHGWYWQADSISIGPFDTEAVAIADARGEQ